MVKILVLVAGYPDNNGCVDLMYVHTRNCYYAQHGIDVTVLNADAESDYIKDGIKVISLESFEHSHESYDVLLSHASNLKFHYRFLKKHQEQFPRIIFFYHGHEVLKINKVYPKPFPYVHQDSWMRKSLQNLYDDFKLFIWRHYLPKIAFKSQFVFVSSWMKEEFLKWTRIPEKVISCNSCITYNSISSEFETLTYDAAREKKYDFITIRGTLDGSKYCLDVVNGLAKNTPDKDFLVIGKGDFFKYNEKADNITWLDTRLTHDEMIDYLNSARFALMPTRTDAQGLMMCEMAAFGIPVITSDIPVCHEVFGDFANAYFLDNDDGNLTLNEFDSSRSVCLKHDRYYADNTVSREVDIIRGVL